MRGSFFFQRYLYSQFWCGSELVKFYLCFFKGQEGRLVLFLFESELVFVVLRYLFVNLYEIFISGDDCLWGWRREQVEILLLSQRMEILLVSFRFYFFFEFQDLGVGWGSLGFRSSRFGEEKGNFEFRFFFVFRFYQVGI